MGRMEDGTTPVTAFAGRHGLPPPHARGRLPLSRPWGSARGSGGVGSGELIILVLNDFRIEVETLENLPCQKGKNHHFIGEGKPKAPLFPLFHQLTN